MSAMPALAGEPLHGKGVFKQLRRLFVGPGQTPAQPPSVKGAADLVTLLFQDILQEDRVSPLIRVWFSRLQMPVMHEALAEPDTFSDQEHPARLLVAHMGSCAMGFHGGDFPAGALEREIRRVVLFIEQYPESGKRAYQQAYQEFQQFLTGFPVEKEFAQHLDGVAYQKEKEKTLTIQYTINLRDMLAGVPVHDEIRDFLFSVWSEVLAVAALRQGKQHPDTLALEKAAKDLLWAARAQPSRIDRAGIIRYLPALLQTLRAGMGLLEFPVDTQNGHIKKISATLTDIFLSNRLRITQTTDPAPLKLPRQVAKEEVLCGVEVIEDDSDRVWGLWDKATDSVQTRHPAWLDKMTLLDPRTDNPLAIVEAQHPRIAKAIRSLWGRQECSIYINKLIMDGSDGLGHDRIGFNQGVANAMMALAELHDEKFKLYEFDSYSRMT